MSGANLTIPGLGDVVEIGRGGFGVVYRASETQLGRDVAVKVLTGALDERAKTHFERERRAMAALSGHPNIVTIFRSGIAASGAPYFVMEYLSGGSLAHQLAANGPTSWEQAAHIGIQLSGALAAAHGAGVLHQDVKPDNVLLTGSGTPKLGDFGIARLDDRPEAESDLVTASVAHAPPEVISGQTPDERADVYSLASTLYELVSGTAAFTRASDESLIPVIARIAHDPVPDVRRLGVPSEVAVVLERAMAKHPDDRYPSATDFGAALIDVQRELGVEPTTTHDTGNLFADAEPARQDIGSRMTAGAAAGRDNVRVSLSGDSGTADSRSRANSGRAEYERSSATRPITRRWLAGAAVVIVLAILIGGFAGYLTSRNRSNGRPNSHPPIDLVAE